MFEFDLIINESMDNIRLEGIGRGVNTANSGKRGFGWGNGRVCSDLSSCIFEIFIILFFRLTSKFCCVTSIGILF